MHGIAGGCVAVKHALRFEDCVHTKLLLQIDWGAHKDEHLAQWEGKCFSRLIQSHRLQAQKGMTWLERMKVLLTLSMSGRAGFLAVLQAAARAADDLRFNSFKSTCSPAFPIPAFSACHRAKVMDIFWVHLPWCKSFGVGTCTCNLLLS